MFPWRIIVGAVVGAAMVKESRTVEKLYTAARRKLVALKESVRRASENQPDENAPEAETQTDPGAVFQDPGHQPGGDTHDGQIGHHRQGSQVRINLESPDLLGLRIDWIQFSLKAALLQFYQETGAAEFVITGGNTDDGHMGRLEYFLNICPG